MWDKSLDQMVKDWVHHWRHVLIAFGVGVLVGALVF